MHISHKVDYGLRVITTLARCQGVEPGRPVSTAALAEREHLPPGFLSDVLRLLRNGELVRSVRGYDGGWVLARPADAITAADVIRVLDGPLATVRGLRPHELPDQGADAALVSLWIAVRAALRSVLEHVTVADLASCELPLSIQELTNDPDSWDAHRLPRATPT